MNLTPLYGYALLAVGLIVGFVGLSLLSFGIGKAIDRERGGYAHLGLAGLCIVVSCYAYWFGFQFVDPLLRTP